MTKPFDFVFSGSDADMENFGELFRRFYPRMKSYAVYFLKNNDEAEDLVQDVFVQSWNQRMKLNAEKNIASFIFVQLKNRCLNSLRKRVIEEKYLLSNSHLETEELYSISFSQAGEFVSMKEQLERELNQLISKMPEKCGQAFALKWLEEKKIREIAEIMNISTTMVDKHLAKGLEIARAKLSPDAFLFLFFLRK